MQTMTTEQIAALSILYGTKSEQTKIFKQIKHATGSCCPNCSNDDAASLEDNGARWEDLTYLCVKCGHQWDAAEVTIDLPMKARRP